MLLQYFDFCNKFELGDMPVMERGDCTRPHCICDCNLEGIISRSSIYRSGGINVI